MDDTSLKLVETCPMLAETIPNLAEVDLNMDGTSQKVASPLFAEPAKFGRRSPNMVESISMLGGTSPQLVECGPDWLKSP